MLRPTVAAQAQCRAPGRLTPVHAVRAMHQHSGMTGANHGDLRAVQIDGQAQHRRESPGDRAFSMQYPL